MKKTTQKELISKLKQYYKEYNYNYSKVKYVDSNTRIIITCPKHGDFTIFPCEAPKS